MIKSLYRFIFIALALPLVMASCHDEVEAVVDDGMEFQMVLRIPSAEGEPGATRGMTKAPTTGTPEYPDTNYGTDEEGEGLDYYVTGKDLTLLFCKNNVVVDYAVPSETKFVTAQGGFYEFFVRGKLNVIKTGDPDPYDIVVMANTRGMLHFNQDPFDRLAKMRENNEIIHEDLIYPNLIFEYTSKGITGDDHDIAYKFTKDNFGETKTSQDAEPHARVPMWGRIVGQYLNEGLPIEIPIMRSLAKIRIELGTISDTNFTYEIDSITMVGASTRGTLMPRDAHNKVTTKTLPSGYNNVGGKVKTLDEWWPGAYNNYDAQNIPFGTVHNHLHLKFYKKDDNKFYTYVPETVNNSGQFHFNVYLKRKHKTENVTSQQRYRMEFGKYTFNSDNVIQGEYMSVKRNHYYMYRVTKIIQDQIIYIDPWDTEVLPPIIM